MDPKYESHSPERKKISVDAFVRMKSQRKRIVMVTSYDYPIAKLSDESGVDAILVGDSYGMVVLGYKTTIPVSMEELLPVCKAVSKATRNPLLVGDLPFLSYQASEDEAVTNAGRLVKDGGMDAVKLEGGTEIAHIVKAICDVGIPVMGHMGLAPQTATLHSGYRVQGRTAASGERLIRDAKALEEAGVFSIVLDMITEEVAKIITETVSVPTIGIASGRFCDGQVLVVHDILGLYPRFAPKFAKRYAELAPVMTRAISEFASDVRQGRSRSKQLSEIE